MLSAAQRLRRSSEFAAAVRGGRRAGRGSVVVHLHTPTTVPSSPVESGPRSSKPAPGAGAEFTAAPARAGFVVSKAVGNAVVRNTVRRRLRHLVRDRIVNFPPGTSLVVRALPAAAGTSYDQLAVDLDAAVAAARSPRNPQRRAR